MLKFPGNLSVEGFLRDYWQKTPLAMPAALDRVHPAITRNELAWLATLEDVESRIVYTERTAAGTRYRVASGPFEADELAALPPRDWTLLVHDVDKHLPELRELFAVVPFIPDWRIDDLMISFAAPGGSVGPHRDNYDVFLCQGIGVREWRVAADEIAADPDASDDLELLAPFAGDEVHNMRHGDVLYLPPGVPHWGVAQRACMTYSIGMRAPSASEIVDADDPAHDALFYTDPDLLSEESRPGYLSPQARARAAALAAAAGARNAPRDELLGRVVTSAKAWLQPEVPDKAEVKAALEKPGRHLRLHGMARVAWDEQFAYVNGNARPLDAQECAAMAELCDLRHTGPRLGAPAAQKLLRWLLRHGAFDLSA